MPQLDITTYTSQIFWFAICFAALFTFASKVILPRIDKILTDRQGLIDSDLKDSQNLQAKLDDLVTQTEELRKKANSTYKIKIEEVNKEAAINRQNLLKQVTLDIKKSTEESRSKLQDFIKQTDEKAQKSTQDLTQQIRDKLIS